MQQNANATWQNASRPRLPMFTYYTFLSGSGGAEGTQEVAAMNDAVVLATSTIGAFSFKRSAAGA
jgi:hypothetical protein